MEENWCALCLAILKGLTPEQSFDILNRKSNLKQKQNRFISECDILQMIELKKTMTYEEIGEMYGLSATATYRRIKRFKEKARLKGVKVS